MLKLALFSLMVSFAFCAVGQTTKAQPKKQATKSTAANTSGGQFPAAAELNQMAARFAPTPLKVDISTLSPGDKQALAKLIEAGRIFDHLFMDQFWSGDNALYKKLQKDKTPLGQARLKYFWINKGPWSEIDDHKAFMPGVPPRKPLGANFYPEDMTKETFESWLSTLNDGQKEQATGFFTVIGKLGNIPSQPGFRRGGTSILDPLTIVPYSDEYKGDLTQCAKLLKEAAALTDNASLKRFLSTRADAFHSNNYYESDVAWMDLDAPLDVTIGPYETYNDELFGYKAAYEAYINVRDDAETNKLGAFSKNLQQLEDNLPEDPKFRAPKLGAASPIRVVNEVLSAGDGAHGVQTAAYNLPNDERVVQEKGSKRVMLKNVQEAKFQQVLLPISKTTIAANEQGDVNFEMFFTHILCHELMHGLGPHQIKIGDRDTNPRKELKEIYSAIEEAKADATGLWALQYMMDHAQQMGLDGVLRHDQAAQRQLYITFLASSFRTLRFGTGDAHGRGMAMQFNYLTDKGAFVARPDGTYAIDMTKVKDAVRDLTHDLLTVEANGDYAAAKKMLDTLAVVRPETQRALDKLKNVPTDIAPQFVTADEVAGRNNH
jgi:Peptidase family M49